MAEESRQIFDGERPQSAAEVLSYDTLEGRKLALVRLLAFDSLSQDLVDSVFDESDLIEVIMESFDSLGRALESHNYELIDINDCVLVYTIANMTTQILSRNIFQNIGLELPTADYEIPDWMAAIFNDCPPRWRNKTPDQRSPIIWLSESVVVLFVGPWPKSKKLVDAQRMELESLGLNEAQYSGLFDVVYIRNLQYFLGEPGFEPGYTLVWGRDGDFLIDLRAIKSYEWALGVLFCPWSDTFYPPDLFPAVVRKILEDSVEMIQHVYEPNLPMFKSRVLSLIYALGPKWVMDRVESILQLDERLAGHLAWLREV